MGSNTEKKPWTDLQNSYTFWSKKIKSDNFCYRKVGIAITKGGNREKSNIVIAILDKWRIWTNPISPFWEGEGMSCTRLAPLEIVWYMTFCSVRKYIYLYLGIQFLKILLLPPKYKIITVPSNYLFFQYSNSTIGLFSIAPCKVITLDPLCILFWYQFLASFLMALSLKLSLLKAIAK